MAKEQKQNIKELYLKSDNLNLNSLPFEIKNKNS